MISPSLCGWPTNRLRKFGCLLHREKIAWLGNSEEFYRCFQRDLQLTGDVFFDLAPAEDIIEHMLFRSRNRGNHPSVTSISKPEDIKLESMITPAMNDRIKEYAKLREGKAGPFGEFLVDLGQNAGYAACGPNVLCIPTHSSVYSYRKSRLMLGKELLCSMGVLDQ